jgi:hypothetical protein
MGTTVPLTTNADPSPVQAQEEHRSTPIAAQCLHRRIVHDLDRTFEGGGKVESDPARREVAWFGDDLPLLHTAGVADRHHFVLPIFRETLDPSDHLRRRHRGPGWK